jgi:hypothetical protein
MCVSILTTELSVYDGCDSKFLYCADLFLDIHCLSIRTAIMNKMENSENKEPERSDVEGDEEFERRPSTMPNIGAHLTGFSTRDFKEKVGAGVLGCLYNFGKVLNLKRLFKIIVVYDYRAALAGLDRGVETSRRLTATENGIAVGIAMTPAILHQGEPRSVLVLNAAYMTALADFEDASTVDLRDVALYTLAHECGHVHDLDAQATSLPNVVFNRRLGYVTVNSSEPRAAARRPVPS